MKKIIKKHRKKIIVIAVIIIVVFIVGVIASKVFAGKKGGASSSIGWIKSVSATEHTKWLKRFVNKLSKGATLSEATKYANSFSYSDYNVKTTWMYGNLNTKICSTSK